MTDTQHDKLIARIQFFYDILSLKHDQLITEIVETNEGDKISSSIVSVLSDEYRRLFEDILYME